MPKSCLQTYIVSSFVPDETKSVADYISTLMGVVVIVVVGHLHNGITHFELSCWNFAWWLVKTIYYGFEFGSQFCPRRPTRPAKSLFLEKKFLNGLTWPIFVRFGLNFVQRSLINLFRDSECLSRLRPFFDQPARVIHPIWMKFGMGANNGAKTT